MEPRVKRLASMLKGAESSSDSSESDQESKEPDVVDGLRLWSGPACDRAALIEDDGECEEDRL